MTEPDDRLDTKLRVLRARRGLTLREAAALTGVAKETISDLERGRRHPYDVTLAKLAAGYGVDLEELIEESASPVPKAAAPSPPETSAEARRALFTDPVPDERSLVFLDQLRGWMTDVEARLALKVDHFTLMKLCDERTLRCADTPLGRLFDPHCVSSLKNKMVAEKKM